MIERHWKGIAKKEKAEEYIAHLQNDTFLKLAKIEGFIAARILNRNYKEGVEFLIVTQWESIDAIRQFSGHNIDVAVVPEEVKRMMLDFDKDVLHYNINFQTSNEGM